MKKENMYPRRTFLSLFLSAIFCLTLAFSVPITARADIGPKPSVHIRFTGAEGQTYYGTLLSQKDSVGPSSAYEKYGTASYRDGEYGLWKTFVDYEDVDGFFFLQEIWDCSETNELDWTYYPPSSFKILLYFPESDSFCVSPVYERYAFDSYFTADLTDYMGGTVNATGSLTASRSYDYTWETISLAARIVLTIALELLIAFLFRYREKETFLFFASVNTVTQVLLNVLLNVTNYRSGPWAFVSYYILLELLVVTLEAILYICLLHRFSMKPVQKGRAIAYALTANIASFAAGLWLAHLIPGIF